MKLVYLFSLIFLSIWTTFISTNYKRTKNMLSRRMKVREKEFEVTVISPITAHTLPYNNFTAFMDCQNKLLRTNANPSKAVINTKVVGWSWKQAKHLPYDIIRFRKGSFIRYCFSYQENRQGLYRSKFK